MAAGMRHIAQELASGSEWGESYCVPRESQQVSSWGRDPLRFVMNRAGDQKAVRIEVVRRSITLAKSWHLFYARERSMWASSGAIARIMSLTL